MNRHASEAKRKKRHSSQLADSLSVLLSLTLEFQASTEHPVTAACPNQNEVLCIMSAVCVCVCVCITSTRRCAREKGEGGRGIRLFVARGRGGSGFTRFFFVFVLTILKKLQCVCKHSCIFFSITVLVVGLGSPSSVLRHALRMEGGGVMYVVWEVVAWWRWAGVKGWLLRLFFTPLSPPSPPRFPHPSSCKRKERCELSSLLGCNHLQRLRCEVTGGGRELSGGGCEVGRLCSLPYITKGTDGDGYGCRQAYVCIDERRTGCGRERGGEGGWAGAQRSTVKYLVVAHGREGEGEGGREWREAWAK